MIKELVRVSNDRDPESSNELGDKYVIFIPSQGVPIELFLGRLSRTQQSNILPIPHHRRQLIFMNSENGRTDSPMFPHESTIIE
jgi:hypothetical protein